MSDRHPAKANPKRWRRLRLRIFDAANWRCAKCGGLARELDHKVPVERGGAWWDESNLQPLCTACHHTKSRGEQRARRPPAPGELAWEELIANRLDPS